MSPERTIRPELQEKVDRELEPGEQIRWIDMPIPRFFTRKATGAFLFATVWTAFAVFWTVGAAGVTRHGPDEGGFSLFPFFGVPFILIGAAMLLSPLWAYRKAFKTVYLITDRRALTIDGGWSTTIRSYPPDKLQDIYRHERKDGTGDVIIARRALRDSEGYSRSEELGFLRIENPREVEQMLKELAEQAYS